MIQSDVSLSILVNKAVSSVADLEGGVGACAPPFLPKFNFF